MWQNSPDGQRPLALGYPVADYASGMGLLSGVLMALLLRERTGEGSKVETSLLEGLLFSMVQEVTEANHGHRLTQGDDSLCGIFAAQDGFLVVMPIWSPTAAADFLGVVGLADAIADPRLATKAARQQNAAWVRELVESRLRTNTVAFWMERLEEKRLLCAPVLRMTDLQAHPQVRAIHPFVAMRDSAGNVIGTGVRPPMTVAGHTGDATIVPALGEQGAELLSELGYAPAAIQAMGEAGVVMTGSRAVRSTIPS